MCLEGRSSIDSGLVFSPYVRYYDMDAERGREPVSVVKVEGSLALEVCPDIGRAIRPIYANLILVDVAGTFFQLYNIIILRAI